MFEAETVCWDRPDDRDHVTPVRRLRPTGTLQRRRPWADSTHEDGAAAAEWSWLKSVPASLRANSAAAIAVASSCASVPMHPRAHEILFRVVRGGRHCAPTCSTTKRQRIGGESAAFVAPRVVVPVGSLRAVISADDECVFAQPDEALLVSMGVLRSAAVIGVVYRDEPVLRLIAACTTSPDGTLCPRTGDWPDRRSFGAALAALVQTDDPVAHLRRACSEHGICMCCGDAVTDEPYRTAAIGRECHGGAQRV
jgi:hypothetical protein